MKRLIFLLFLSVLSISSCTPSTNSSSTPHSSPSDNTTSADVSSTSEASSVSLSTQTYEQITQDEAKRLMDTESGYIIIDARTEEEFAEGHIKNAILIPEYEITEKAGQLLPDKSQLILVYCRSGRRSKIAAQALAELGYTNVKEFGGIITWEYEIVK